MDMELVMRAAAYAAEAHAKQMRKTGDEPYINHPLRVSHMAVRAGLGAEAVAAALLHDVVEDTERSLDDIRAVFPERVTLLVHLLTQWWADDAPAAEKNLGKPKYYAAILAEPDAIDVKLLDRSDNLWSMVRMLPSNRGWAERYLRRTKEEITPVLKASRNETAKKYYLEAVKALEAALGPERAGR
ncbi:Bifunctional (p)ppGpp synthase/hydrolase relA [compost metagenome]